MCVCVCVCVCVFFQVGLILTVEAGIFPLMSGWWIDVCAMVCMGACTYVGGDMFTHGSSGLHHLSVVHEVTAVHLADYKVPAGMVWDLCTVLA